MIISEFIEKTITHAREILIAYGYILPTLWHRDDITDRIEDCHKDKIVSILVDPEDIDAIAEILNKNHDANEGINWDTIDIAINEHFNQKKNED